MAWKSVWKGANHGEAPLAPKQNTGGTKTVPAGREQETNWKSRLKPIPPSTGYAKRFQDKDDVESYDLKEYGAGSYSTRIWELQRPLLVEILERHQSEARRPLSLLDFACGTGRVLACLESLVNQADGIDISPEMAAVARTKCARSRLQVGDILTQPELLQKITTSSPRSASC
jgi:hypothetical protein